MEDSNTMLEVIFNLFTDHPKLLKIYLDKAIDTLLERDLYLLKKGLHERAISHRLAVYIEWLFGQWFDVDCEYNGDEEHESGRKIIENICIKYSGNNSKKFNCNNCRNEVSVYPDIIVHKRRVNKFNLFIIEVKKVNLSHVLEIEKDIYKLKQYTKSTINNKNKFCYKYGVFIGFYIGDKAKEKSLIKWFKNGEELTID